MQARLTLLLLTLCLASTVCAQNPRYTFSWPLSATALQPRGGTTQGPELRIATEESAAWRRLREPQLSAFERDRRAILAMAGAYRVTFDFLEVLSFKNERRDPESMTQRPYQSWATEKIYVDRDEGGFISLVHILEMRVRQPDGTLSPPMVTKHWRQDWQYEPTHVVEYQGNATWRRRAVKPAERKGRWSQTVYQVDESPRYASLGTWEHTDTFSSWLSGDTWRPLPRREWSVRKDYDILAGTNRHTIVAAGWVQEENNLKSVLRADGTLAFIAREYGMARYERLSDPDFDAADAYYDKTRNFWQQVRLAWANGFERDTTIRLRGQVDQLQMFVPLFEQAEALAGDPAAAGRNAEVIRSALQDMRAAKP